MCFYSQAQLQTQIVGDSVRLRSNTGTSELILENSTKSIKGFLYNLGNGRTEFKKAIMKLNDTLYVIGDDTLNLSKGLLAHNGLTKNGNSVGLGGDLQGFTNINLRNNRLVFNSMDGSNVGNTGGITISAKKDNITGADNFYIQNFHVGSTISTNVGASVFLESWWHSPSPVTSGGFSNFISRHKSTVAGTNYSGVTITGYRSNFETYAGQVYGKLIHFDASPFANTGATIAEYYGLYVAPLKAANTVKSYAIHTAGAEDSIYNAGPVRWTKYSNSFSEDSVLTTDSKGNVKMRFMGPSENSTSNTATSSINFPGTASGASSDFPVTIAGATDGDIVSLGVPQISTSPNSCFTAWVSAPNTVTIRFNNYSAAAIDPASGNFKVKVIK